MKLSSEEYDLIEKYLDGNLSSSEEDSFQKKYESSSDFREEADLQKSLVGQIKKLRESDLKRDMGAHLSKLRAQESKESHRTGKTWLYAAASVLILISSFFIWNLNQQPSRDYIDYFQPYPDVITVRNTEDSLSQTFSNYSSGEFEEAIAKFSIMPPSDTINFYIAQCHISIAQYDSAIAYLETIPDHSIFLEQKRWYLGLCYLLTNDLENAELLLNEIKQGEFKYNAKQELIESL